jgi:hypothetical protein
MGTIEMQAEKALRKSKRSFHPSPQEALMETCYIAGSIPNQELVATASIELSDGTQVGEIQLDGDGISTHFACPVETPLADGQRIFLRLTDVKGQESIHPCSGSLREVTGFGTNGSRVRDLAVLLLTLDRATRGFAPVATPARA